MYRFCRNSPIFSVFICKTPIYAREIFKVLRDSLIYSDLYPPVRERGFRRSGAAAPRPTHRSVPSAYALHAAARTAPMRIEPVYSKQHAVKRAVAMFVSCCCLPLIDTMITPMFSVRTPLKQYETTRTRKTMFFTFCNMILNYWLQNAFYMHL